MVGRIQGRPRASVASRLRCLGSAQVHHGGVSVPRYTQGTFPRAHAKHRPHPTQGLILTGSPGSGKSFLIDLWFSGMPTPFKARKHYNQLVLEMYRGVWEETQLRMASAQASRDSTRQAPVEVAWGKNLKKQLQALVSKGSLPIKWNSRHLSDVYGYTPTIAFAVAQRLVQRHWLLVFDEIQLLDVSSATLLADVLSWFWRMGGVIVGTSNKVPDDLYKNGVQRERLQPFVEALKIRSPVHTMKSETDWREVASEGASSSWYTVEQQEAFQGHSDTLLQEPGLFSSPAFLTPSSILVDSSREPRSADIRQNSPNPSIHAERLRVHICRAVRRGTSQMCYPPQYID